MQGELPPPASTSACVSCERQSHIPRYQALRQPRADTLPPEGPARVGGAPGGSGPHLPTLVGM